MKFLQNGTMPKVNPQILVWARETAGLSRKEAAKKLSMSGPDRIRALEAGERDPSRRQLTNMSEKYRRPLLTFYLPNPPKSSDRGQDFRTLPDEPEVGSEALINALLRDVYARQGLVRAALEEAEEDEALAFVGSASMEDGVETLVKSLRELLDFTSDDFRQEKTVNGAFAALRAAAEKAGVFVLLMGNLGTFHTDIDAKNFRGFALADDVAPFIVINEKDSRAAWSFTLLHELAHISLGQTGISGQEGTVEIERFCDSVAAHFLLRPEELVEIGAQNNADLDELKHQIGDFSNKRNLSRKMVAYNLLRSDIIERRTYNALSAIFDDERIAQKIEDEKPKGAPDYYVVRRHRVGLGLLTVVRRLVAGGALTTTKAGRVLGVKPTAVNRIFDGSRAA